jgi:hypothetical protein
MAVQWAEDMQLGGLEQGSFSVSGAVSWDEFGGNIQVFPRSRYKGARHAKQVFHDAHPFQFQSLSQVIHFCSGHRGSSSDWFEFLV